MNFEGMFEGCFVHHVCMMAGRVQEAIAGFKSGPASPVKEPPAKASWELDEGQVALAAYLKKDLGEMIDEKVGRQITKVKDQMSAMATATDDGSSSSRRTSRRRRRNARSGRQTWKRR